MTNSLSARTSTNRMLGYRWLHELLESKGKAARFRYYKWRIWIPLKALVYVDGRYTTPLWAIDSAKRHGSSVLVED